MSPLLRKLHRWIALVFALPLVVVLVTGLILSFEPWLVTRAIVPGKLTAEKVAALLAKHDPGSQARGIVYRTYDSTLTIGAGRGGGTVVDAASGEKLQGPSAMANLLITSRRMHETLLIDAGWLVVASTIAMLALAAIGVFMGLPQQPRSIGGWHKLTAWSLLPLVVLSPLTGLFIAWGITFQSPRPAGGGAEKTPPLRLAEAVQIVGRSHDLSGLVWIRPQGGGMAARIVEGGEYRGFRVTREGTQATPRNWPRLWHEGNFAGGWSALLNVITSFALIGLLVTGVTVWAQRWLRRSRYRAARAATADA